MVKKVLKNTNFSHVVMNFAQLSTALVFFILGSTLVVLLANLFFPKMVVLGHHLISPVTGAVYAMTVVSLIAVGVMPVVEYIAKQKNINFTSTHWLLLYWVVNIGAIWLVGRFAEIVGMGINSWMVAVVLGLALDLVQGALMIHVVSKVKSG
ncbi:hypothetical protein KKE34_03530 [Patescibacteria group bacterium]|nr:hypothetical protein [Patescibacteria group bacterium]MBU1885653.1 hypothetical protein [Patescibacteria group bacterium]